MLTAITGINWGDEGKGRMVDLLCRDYDIVARYQGGDNAGHTVKNECGKFVLNLVPSGILHPNIVCVMGGGMVIDPEHLEKEIAALREQGVKITCGTGWPGGGPPCQNGRTVWFHQARHCLHLW